MDQANSRLSQAELTAIFSALGAPDPAGWAASEVREDIPQLASFLILKTAWHEVVDDSDDGWIDAALAQAKRQPSHPYAGVGHALRRLLASGAARQDIVDVVRGMQAELLFHLFYVL